METGNWLSRGYKQSELCCLLYTFWRFKTQKNSGVFMLFFRLLGEILPWRLPISSYQCYLIGLLKSDQVSLLARGSSYRLPLLCFLAPAGGQDPCHLSEGSSGTGPGSLFARDLANQGPTSLIWSWWGDLLSVLCTGPCCPHPVPPQQSPPVLVAACSLRCNRRTWTP